MGGASGGYSYDGEGYCAVSCHLLAGDAYVGGACRFPGQIVVSGFLTINGEKISKTIGNVIDPLDVAARYGVDALRYFLLREVPFGEDGDFSEVKMKERYNGDLANGLGNFAARILALAEKEELKSGQLDPAFDLEISKDAAGRFRENKGLSNSRRACGGLGCDLVR